MKGKFITKKMEKTLSKRFKINMLLFLIKKKLNFLSNIATPCRLPIYRGFFGSETKKEDHKRLQSHIYNVSNKDEITRTLNKSIHLNTS